MLTLRTALLSLALAGFAAAQEACSGCGGLGLVPCVRHAAEDDRARWCSAVGGCASCGGAGSVDCPRCDADVEAELARRRQRAAEQRRRDARELGELAADTVTVELEQVRVTVGTSRALRVDGRSLDAHQLAHHVAEIVAAVRTDFVTTLGLTAADLPVADDRTTSDPERLAAGGPELRLLLFRDRADARRASPRFVGLDLNGLGVLRLGSAPAACVHLDPDAIPDAAALRRVVANLTARLLLAQTVGHAGDSGHGWIEAGIAHLFEARFGEGGCAFLGFGEVALRPAATYRGGDWSDAVRRLAEQRALRPFVALAALQHEELDLEAHAQARALIEFLLETGGGPVLVRTIRQVLAGADPVAGFEAAYGTGERTLDQRFADRLLGR